MMNPSSVMGSSAMVKQAQQMMNQGQGVGSSPSLFIPMMQAPAGANNNEDMLRAMQLTMKSNIYEALSILPSPQVAKLLEENPDLVTQEGFNGIAPLHKAVLRGDPSLVETFLNYGAFPNVTNSFEETPLHFACKVGNPVVIHKLINAGADLEARDKNGRSAMHHAAQGGSVLSMHYLVEVHHVDPRVTDNNLITPLHLCCAHGHQEGIDYLMRQGRSNVNAMDIHGNTAMHIAGQYGQVQACWRLMELGGIQMLHQTNKDGLNPLQLASKNDHAKNQKLVKLLDVYMSVKQKSGPVEGPKPLWYTLLLTPCLAFYATLYLAHCFENSAIFMMIGVGLMGYFIYGQGHRLDHISRWPNPIQVGMFASGIFNTMIFYLVNVFPSVNMDRPVFGMFSVLVCFIVSVLYYKLMTGDPGICRESAKKERTGQCYSVLDIANSEVRLQALCNDCEIIPPRRSRHCKICQQCYLDCDHHCLFLYKCVARYNHRLFLLFIFCVICSMVAFSYLVLEFTFKLFPTVAKSYAVMKAMQVYPGTVMLALINFLSAIWLCTLFFTQLKLLSKGHTTAYQPNRGYTRLTYAQRLKNLAHFFAGKVPYALDPVN